MYQILNLPREFVHPPLYLMRQESKPKELAKRMALALRPTLRNSVQIGYQQTPKKAPAQKAPKRQAVLTPAAARAIAPAGLGNKVVMGQPRARITNALPNKAMKLIKRPLTPKRVPMRSGLPLVRIFEYAPAGGNYAQTVMQGGQAAEALNNMRYK